MPDGPSEGKALQRGQPAGAQGCAGGNLPVFSGTAGQPEPGRKGKTKTSLDWFFPGPGADVPTECILQRFILLCSFFFPFSPFLASRGIPVPVPGLGRTGQAPPEKVGTAAASGAEAAVNARVTHPPRSLIPCTPNRFSLFSFLTPISGITKAAELSGFSKSLMNAS